MVEIDRRSDMTGPPRLGSLPYLRLESKARGIFGDGSFDLVGCSGWEFSVDFDGDVQRCVGVAGEKGDDLVGDLNQSHFCGRSIDFDRAVKGLRLCRLR